MKSLYLGFVGAIFIFLNGVAFADVYFPPPPDKSTQAAPGQPNALHRDGDLIGRYIVNYDDLKKHHAECETDNDSRKCVTAARNFCQSKGYASGLGLVDVHRTGGQVVCMPHNIGQEIHTTFTQLSAHLDACDRPQHARLNVCQAAVKRYCTINDFDGGGFGPLEFNNTDAVIFCVNKQNGTEISTSYSVLKEFDENCSGPSAMASTSCLRATDRYCQSEGFGASQPVSETGSIDNKFYCLGEGVNKTEVQPQFENARLASRSYRSDKLPSEVIPIGNIGLDAGPMAQLPSNNNLFLMRKKNTTVNETWSLILGRYNWDSHLEEASEEISEEKTVLQTPFDIYDEERGRYVRIYTALDPSVMRYQGRNWVAFECQAFNLYGKPGRLQRSQAINPNVETSNSTCIAQLNSNNTISTGSVKILVSGRNYDSIKRSTDSVSASVPKLFTHQNKPYLYWTTVNQEIPSNDPNGRIWKDIQTRGVELSFDSKKKELFVKGHKDKIFEANHPDAVTVLDSTFQPDPKDNSFYASKVADIFDVISDGMDVYISAAVSDLCLEPRFNTKNCYRIALAKSNNPLKVRGFNSQSLGVFPDQSGEYFTFVRNEPTTPSSQNSTHGIYLSGVFVEHNGNPDNAYEEKSRHIIKLGTYIGPIEHGVCVNKKIATLDTPGWRNFNGSCLPQCNALDIHGTSQSTTLAAHGKSCADEGLISAGVSIEPKACCIME